MSLLVIGYNIKHREVVAKCQNCQQVNYKNQSSEALLQKILIPEWKLDNSLNFVVGLPVSLGKFHSIWVVVYRFTKLAHFILVRDDYNDKQLARIYVK